MSSDFKKIFQAREMTPPPTVAPETEKGKTKKLQGKRSDPNFTQVSAYIPKDLHRRVKVELMEGDRQFSDLVTELLTQWLENK